MYLKTTGSDEHEHTFVEYPGLTFYMVLNDQGYHGASSPKSNVTDKPKLKSMSFAKIQVKEAEAKFETLDNNGVFF